MAKKYNVLPSDYLLIPFTDIIPEARELAVLWGDNMRDDSIQQRHKLASDFMNYAHWYHRQHTPPENYEYSIIPVTFKDYNEYVNCLNDFGKHGWQFTGLIRVYNNSPSPGFTTHDLIAKRKKLNP